MKLREIKEYHSNGKLHIHYYEDEKGLVQGEYRDYWWDGKPWEIYNCKNGEIFGIGLDYI